MMQIISCRNEEIS